MPSLKDLKNRITSVKSTRKITSAMKMVAASKLRRAQEQAEAARPYGEAMARMLKALASGLEPSATGLHPLLVGTGSDEKILLLVITSDRGLCGGFNGSIVRETRRLVRSLQNSGKQVSLYCIGRKGRDLLRRDFSSLILPISAEHGNKKLDFADASKIADNLLQMFEDKAFDQCLLVYNHFKSVMSQVVTQSQLIPLNPDSLTTAESPATAAPTAAQAMMIFEPDQTSILNELLPRNLAVQIYGALLDNLAGEMGARMTAMDNATRNAGDMINRLTLQYNRSRQAYITKELIEIISGAEAI
jgi:F-type H+-transporting ATPase subunit gamma